MCFFEWDLLCWFCVECEGRARLGAEGILIVFRVPCLNFSNFIKLVSVYFRFKRNLNVVKHDLFMYWKKWIWIFYSINYTRKINLKIFLITRIWSRTDIGNLFGYGSEAIKMLLLWKCFGSLGTFKKVFSK